MANFELSTAATPALDDVDFELATPALAADSGSFTISGTAATLTRSNILLGDSGAFTITGTDATLSKSNTDLVAGAGSLTVSGTAASLEYQQVVLGDIGEFSISGTAATLTRSNTAIPADAGAVTVTGTDAALVYGTPSGDADFSLTATTPPAFDAVDFELGESAVTLACDSGSVAISGTAATFDYELVVEGDIGAFAIAGTEATLSTTSSAALSAESGAFTVTGTAATLVYFSSDGTDFALTVTATPALDAVDFELGTPAVTMTAYPGVFEVTGTDVAFIYEPASTLTANSGAISISGSTANLLYSGAPTRPTVKYRVLGAVDRQSPYIWAGY